MPQKWTIDHAQCLVTMTAEGEVTLEQAKASLDAVVVLGGRHSRVVRPNAPLYHLAAAERPVEICKTVAEAEASLARQEA